MRIDWPREFRAAKWFLIVPAAFILGAGFSAAYNAYYRGQAAEIRDRLKAHVERHGLDDLDAFVEAEGLRVVEHGSPPGPADQGVFWIVRRQPSADEWPESPVRMLWMATPLEDLAVCSVGPHGDVEIRAWDADDYNLSWAVVHLCPALGLGFLALVAWAWLLACNRPPLRGAGRDADPLL